MSALTKIFIVLHVVVSLMLAAGLIVFVNRIETFKTTLASQKATNARVSAQLINAQAEAAAQTGYTAEARLARDNAITDGQKSLATAQEEIASGKAALAEAQSGAKTLQVSIDNMTAALNASEAQRTAIATILETTRTDNNTLNTKNSQLNLAISDLTNKLDVLVRKSTDYQETIAENKSKIETLEKQMADAGLTPGTNSAVAGTGAGAPPINGVISSSRLIKGIPYATINVGSNAQVVRGMKFNVVDSVHSKFLGELTIEQVDEREATGKLEGPAIGEVKNGTEVKTQL